MFTADPKIRHHIKRRVLILVSVINHGSCKVTSHGPKYEKKCVFLNEGNGVQTVLSMSAEAVDSAAYRTDMMDQPIIWSNWRSIRFQSGESKLC
jgi:hypothetical protein